MFYTVETKIHAIHWKILLMKHVRVIENSELKDIHPVVNYVTNALGNVVLIYVQFISFVSRAPQFTECRMQTRIKYIFWH